MFSTILISLSLLFGFGTVSQAVVSDTGLIACEYEDSANCFWNAGTSGNGAGDSFVDVDGDVYYACEAEEDTNCFWDAREMGNGKGRSFTDVNGVALYWDEVNTEEGAWDTFDALGIADTLDEGGKVSFLGLGFEEIDYEGKIEAGGYFFWVQ